MLRSKSLIHRVNELVVHVDVGSVYGDHCGIIGLDFLKL